IAYLPRSPEEKETSAAQSEDVPPPLDEVREFIVTSILAEDRNEEVLGALVVGVPVETNAERQLDRFEKENIAGDTLRTGIFLEGQLYSHQIPEAVFEPLAQAVMDSLERHAPEPSAEGEPTPGEFVTLLGGIRHRVHYCALNPGTSLPTAYQIGTFSLEETMDTLTKLYVRGASLGLLLLSLGWISSYFLARGLSVPINELSQATLAIRSGELDIRVPVRGQDELAILSQSFNHMAEDLGQKESYRKLLEKVSDEAVAQAMIDGSLNVELGGELKEVTILFCDIRGFTALTEDMAPEGVIAFLNDHMTAMTRIVREHHGVVDKFIGDEVMAVFGALKSYGNDAANAVRCAQEMIREREQLNAAHSTPLHLGVGIATGQVVAGCMGSVDRLNYTVLGARVNLAARLCGQAAPSQILIDDLTRQQVTDEPLDLDELSPLDLK
ncbi:MAG: adenylate/guanylate cyclase domain-containing protein, partial [Verrucomicrobiota bacterium]